MKNLRRIASLLLSIALACPAVIAAPVTAMAADEVPVGIKGSIGITIGFELPQTLENVENRNIELKLSKGSETAEFSLNTGEKSGDGFDKAKIFISAKNEDGVELTTESVVGAYEAVISNLETGKYNLELTGEGMTDFSERVEIDDYSKHLIVANSNGTFSVGDVDGNGRVNDKDREELAGELGTNDEKYDLNGDGIVDVVDLAYVNRVMGNDDEAQVYETNAISDMTVNIENISIKNVDELFDDENDVEIRAKEGEVIIPVTFGSGVEMEQIAITSPVGNGAVEGGTALVEYADGTEETIAFGSQMPEGVYAIGREAGRSTVVIELGKRVAVKKVTIKVTKVTGDEEGYAAITKIEFLKDIVPDVIDTDASKVKGVTATGGDKKVSLRWNTVNNAAGYIINYGTDKNSLNKTYESSKISAEISGLENFKTYYFTITAANGSWRGKPSEVVSAMPAPQSVPGAPSNIRVEEANKALRVSWGKTKDAYFYQAFYRIKGDSEFIQFGENTEATNMTITGLTNGTVYEIAVKAGNDAGVGGFSAIAEGTPKEEVFEEPSFPTDGKINREEITSIVMTDKNNYNASLCPNFKVEDLVDGTAGTYWIAKNYWYNSNITYTFSETHDMNYVLVAPYLDAKYRNRIDTYTISAKNEAGDTIMEYMGYVANVNENNYIVFTFPPTENIKSLTLALGEKTGGPRVSISEIAFYDSDTLSGEIANLFEDNAFTRLKSSVTEEQIAALSERLDGLSSFYMDIDVLREELNMASTLLEGRSLTGVVKDNFQSRSAEADSQYGQTASSLQPIGVSAKAEKYIAVYADVPADKPVYLVPTQYYGESGIWSGSAVRLNSGRNFIKIPKIGSLSDTRGGMLYITYAGSRPEEIKIHVPESSNVYKIPVLELSDWYNMTVAEREDTIGKYVEELSDHVASQGVSGNALKTAIQNATEISTPSVLLSLPADRILAGIKGAGNDTDAMTEAMYDNVMAWEELLFVANKTQGIIDADEKFDSYQYPMTTRQNIRYMRMFAGAFMYAAGNHVGIEYGSASGMACGKPTSKTGTSSNRLFGWGIAHEIGHNMDKLGKAEITNNIYSLAVQTWNGSDMTLTSRLTASNIWQQVYDKVSVGRQGSANNVFVQLGMYWQLHLAYDDAENPMGFYNSFFKLWKQGKYKEYDYDNRVALIASEVAGKNLTQFFTHWGMTLHGDVVTKISDYEDEKRAIWYLNDNSRNYRLSGESGGTGTISVSAAANGNKATIKIENSNADGILGYEIRRNGTPIGFTTTDTYIDDLGAANNYTYVYSALPIDVLGNIGEAGKAGEIRIAYNKTIEESLYDMSETDGIVRIEMKGEAVPVTGIIGTAAGTDVVIKVKADKNQADWTIAKQGNAGESGEAIYFNKPKANSDDPRIWPYDVALMEVEGMTDVKLLDYPGDRIDFYGDAAVGILSTDYEYDGGQIDRGTVVVVGEYRGNPVFNTIKLKARYNTTAEAAEENDSIERLMNGYAILLCELPEDMAVSDTSDGMFIFVPDWDEEKALNESDGVTDDYPMEIKAEIYRSDDPNSSEGEYVTSETLWISFPGEEGMPDIDLE